MRKILKFKVNGTPSYQYGGGLNPSFNNGMNMFETIAGKQNYNFQRFSPSNNMMLQSDLSAGNLAAGALNTNLGTSKAISSIQSTVPKSMSASTVNPGKSGIFSKAKIGNTMNVAGQAADMIGSLIPKKEQSALTTGLNQGYDAAANMVGSIPGVGTIIGGAMKIGGMLSDGLTAMGVGTDQMTTTDKILDSKFMKLTPMGLVNAIGAKKADTIYKDQETWEQQGSAYGGSMSKVDDALGKSGKKYGLLSGKARRKANAQIAEAKRQQNLVSDINQEAQDAFAASNYSGIGLRNELALSGGYRNMAVGRNGMKILDAESQWAREVLTKAKIRPKEKLEEQLPKFAEGGKVNVIPDGALHAHKHHLEDISPEYEQVTSKGIPVVTEEEGGKLKQHAEIERNEIIFRLEVTKKLEELMKDGSDDAAIEAGKLLAHEIINNTVDNTGLMEVVE